MQEVVNVFEVFENSEFGSVEVYFWNEKEYFNANQVAELLGYKNTRDAIRRHCKGVVEHSTLKNNGGYPLKLIPEGDLYRLIIGSQLPTAEEFEKWIFDEVIPTIRKTGGYVSNTKMFVNTYFSSMKDEDKQFLIQTLDSKLEAEKKLKKAEERIEKQTVYIDNLTSDLDVVLIRKICTDFVNNTAKESGKAYKDIWNTLYGFLGRALKIDLKYQYDKYISEKLSLVQENRAFNLEHKLKGNDRKFPNTKKEVEISKLEYMCKILGAGSDLINCMAKTFEVDVAVILDRYTYEKS